MNRLSRRQKPYQCDCIVVATIVQLFLVAGSEALADLRRNPFERPAIEPSSLAATTEPEQGVELWYPELRAVLFAGPNSVADLGGVILSIGESANGYRLLAVGDGEATFSNRGEKVVIILHDQSNGQER